MSGLPLSLFGGSLDPTEGDGSHSTSDYLGLKKAFINEKAAPELLPFHEELVGRVTEQVTRMDERICEYAQTPGHELARILLECEVSRAKYLLRVYYRCRLAKIQANVMQVLDVAEYRSRLSERERSFAQDYFVLMAGHLKQQVLDQLPPALQSMVRQQGGGGGGDTAAAGQLLKDMVPQFKLDKHVLCHVMQDKGAVDTQDDGSETIDLEAGDVVVMRYRLVRELVEEGAVELM